MVQKETGTRVPPSSSGSDSRLRRDDIFRKVVTKMSCLWLIPAGMLTIVLVSLIMVVGLGKLMIRHERNKFIREEMAAVEEEYRNLCCH